MSIVIRAAARTLPASMRDRYREQWLADARDATEAGLSPASIALAALAFAVTYDRPFPTPAALTPELVERRARFAAALALSAGLLGLAGFARLSGSSGLTGIDGYDVAMNLIEMLLLAFAVLGSIVAVAIVTRTRAIRTRVRIAVWVLMIAALAPVENFAIEWLPVVQGNLSVYFGGLGYLPAAVAVVIAQWLLWTGLPRPVPRPRSRMRVIVPSALAVLAVGAFAFGQAAIAWASRVPIVWSWLPGTATYVSEDGTMVVEKIYPTQADHEQWLALKEQFESLVAAALVGFAVATVVSVVALLVCSLVFRVRLGALLGGAIAIVLIAGAAVMSIIASTPAQPLVAPELLFAIGRLLLVAVVLYAVGGLGFEPKRSAGVRHRHDVEGAVELL